MKVIQQNLKSWRAIIAFLTMMCFSIIGIAQTTPAANSPTGIPANSIVVAAIITNGVINTANFNTFTSGNNTTATPGYIKTTSANTTAVWDNPAIMWFVMNQYYPQVTTTTYMVMRGKLSSGTSDNLKFNWGFGIYPNGTTIGTIVPLDPTGRLNTCTDEWIAFPLSTGTLNWFRSILIDPDMVFLIKDWFLSSTTPTLPSIVGCSSLDKPVPVVSNPTCNSLQLSWAPISGANSYNLYTVSSAYTNDTVLVQVGVTSPFTHTGLASGNSYYYKVKAIASPTDANLSLAVSGTTTSSPTITGTLSVCVGSTTTLTGSGTPDATTPWASASPTVATVTNLGVVTGVSVGTSVITYKNNYGCTQTATVTVNALPTITGTLSVCGVGSTTTLTGSGTPDGTTPWASASTTVASVTNAGVVTGVSTGTSVITYKNNNGCTKTTTVTVSLIPTVNLTPTALCGSGTVDLTALVAASSTPGLSYVYCTNIGLTICPSNPSAAPISATRTYYIQGTAPTTGCFSAVKSVVVTVNSIPTVTITDPAAVCAPSTVNLTAAAIKAGSTAGLTYTYWTDAGATVALGTPAAVAASGTYYIKGTVPATGCFRIQPVVVTINPIPTALVLTGSTICTGGSGGNQISSSTSVSGINYQLYDSSNATVSVAKAGNGSGLTWSAVPAGTGYYVKGMNSTTSCVSANSNAVNVTVNPLPLLYTISEGGDYCINGSGVEISLSDSDLGASYQLRYEGNNIGIPVMGTGERVVFELQTVEGIYTILAEISGCYSLMNGSAIVSAVPLPSTSTIYHN